MTPHPDVLMVIEPDEKILKIPELVAALAAAVECGDRLQVQVVLAQHVPTFAPFIEGAHPSPVRPGRRA